MPCSVNGVQESNQASMAHIGGLLFFPAYVLVLIGVHGRQPQPNLARQHMQAFKQTFETRDPAELVAIGMDSLSISACLLARTLQHCTGLCKAYERLYACPHSHFAALS